MKSNTKFKSRCVIFCCADMVAYHIFEIPMQINDEIMHFIHLEVSVTTGKWYYKIRWMQSAMYTKLIASKCITRQSITYTLRNFLSRNWIVKYPHISKIKSFPKFSGWFISNLLGQSIYWLQCNLYHDLISKNLENIQIVTCFLR